MMAAEIKPGASFEAGIPKARIDRISHQTPGSM